MRDMTKLPSHLRMTKRQWKSKKRQQAKDVRRLVSELNIGSHFTPASAEITELYELIRKIEDKLSVKKWKALRGE